MYLTKVDRSVGAIVLGPNDSQKTGYYFMSLITGQRLHRRSWTELPMPDEVIKRVESFAIGEPELLIFHSRSEFYSDNSEITGVDSNDLVETPDEGNNIKPGLTDTINDPDDNSSMNSVESIDDYNETTT